MEASTQECYIGNQLQTLGWVRKANKLLHISDILKCDGITIDRAILGDTKGGGSKHIFPRERPIRTDFRLWDEAVERLGGPAWKLVQGVGRYIRPVHRYQHWFVSEDRLKLWYRHEGGPIKVYDEYNKDARGHNARSGQQYTWAREVEDDPPQHVYASVAYEEGTQVVSLHSYCAIPRPPRQPSRFWETLRSFDN